MVQPAYDTQASLEAKIEDLETIVSFALWPLVTAHCLRKLGTQREAVSQLVSS